MLEKALTAILGAVLGSVVTYGAAGIRLEGRMEAVERALVRIETRLFPHQTAQQ